MQWTYRYSHKPWYIDKKIISQEKIEVPAGSFNCYKIQWLQDMDHDNIWDTYIEFFDFINSKKLTHRTIVIKVLQTTDESSE